ncbi:MAG: DUF4097 family beta strand repeat-containing protein [Catenulispora sp.]
MQKFDTTGPISVVLNIPAGRIRLIAGDRTDTTVQILPAQASKKRDAKAAEQTEVDYRDGVLRIATADPHRIFGSSGALDVTVELPAGSRVEGSAGAAELRSTGRLGDVVFEGGYHTVDLDETAGAQLKVHTGDVAIARLTGPARISNGKGDITIAEAVGGEVELRTESGTISITAAAGVSATLDAGTGYGRISNALKNVDGAAAGLKIKATSAHGDITASSV